MDKRFNETYFDAVLMQAFWDVTKEELQVEPTLEELKEKYPPSKRAVKRIKNSLKAKQYKRPLAVLYLQRVAICILAVVALSFAVLLTSSKVQAAISETVVEWYDKYIVINLGNLEDDDESDNNDDASSVFEGVSISEIEPAYIPEGFDLISSVGDEAYKSLTYENMDGMLIVINVSNSDETQNNLDNENTEYEEIEINGIKAYSVYSDEKHFGSIVWGDSGITINLSGDLSKNELRKVAENIKPAEDVLKDKTFKDLEINYLPDGLNLIMEFEDDGSRFYLWEKADDPSITLNITISNSDVLQVYVDNENKTLEETAINGNKAFVSYSEKEHMGTVIWGNKKITVFVDGSFDKETLIKIAKSIKPAEDVLLGKSIGNLTVDYIPDDCVLSTEYEDEMSRDYYYVGNDGKYLSVQIAVADVTMISLDNESSDFEETTINANKAFISYSQENQFGSVVWGNSEIVITVSGLFDRETLVKVAKNIK